MVDQNFYLLFVIDISEKFQFHSLLLVLSYKVLGLLSNM